MRKDRLAQSSTMIDSVLVEFQVLLKNDYYFLLDMEYFYMSKTRLYLVTPFIDGGDLR